MRRRQKISSSSSDRGCSSDMGTQMLAWSLRRPGHGGQRKTGRCPRIDARALRVHVVVRDCNAEHSMITIRHRYGGCLQSLEHVCRRRHAKLFAAWSRPSDGAPCSVSMSTLRRKPSPPAFVRWLQLLLATVLASAHAPSWAKLVGRFRRRSRSASLRRPRHSHDFAPTQVMKRIDGGVDERWVGAAGGVEVSEEDLDTLPVELREALLADGRGRARMRAESTTVA